MRGAVTGAHDLAVPDLGQGAGGERAGVRTRAPARPRPGRAQARGGRVVRTAFLDGDEIDVAFNPGFLLDGLGALGTPFARMSFTQPGKPALLTGQAEADGEADTSYRYVLQPVRLAG